MASQVDLYCQIGRERLLSQEWQYREFATKAINYLTFGSGMIGIGAAVLAVLRLSQPVYIDKEAVGDPPPAALKVVISAQ